MKYQVVVAKGSDRFVGKLLYTAESDTRSPTVGNEGTVFGSVDEAVEVAGKWIGRWGHTIDNIVFEVVEIKPHPAVATVSQHRSSHENV